MLHPRRSLTRALVLTTSLAALGGCSIKTMAVKTVANTLSDTGDVFSRDEDPDLVRDAVPRRFPLMLRYSISRVLWFIPTLLAMIAVRELSATCFSSLSGLPARMLAIMSVCSCT